METSQALPKKRETYPIQHNRLQHRLNRWSKHEAVVEARLRAVGGQTSVQLVLQERERGRGG